MGLVAWASQRPKPSYQGRPLEDYLADLAWPPFSGRYLLASNAVVAVGTDSLPVLLRNIRQPVPPHIRLFVRYQTNLPASLRKSLNTRLDPHRYAYRKIGAVRAIELMGTNAAPIAADLVETFARADYSSASQLALALVRVGPAVVPHLKPHLSQGEVRMRSLAAFVLHGQGPAGAAAAPELIAGLEGADENHRRLVAQTLGRMGSAVLPQVTNLLASADSDTRLAAVRALGMMMPRAQELTRRLVLLLDDPVPEVRIEMALLLMTWWRVPVEEWRRHFASLPTDHPTRVRLKDPLDAIEQSRPRAIAVLREGLAGVAPDLQRRAAMLLVDLGQGDAAVVACLEELSTTTGIAPGDLAGMTNVLSRARRQLTNGSVSGATETWPRPGTAPAAQSPPSRDPPLADKSP